MRLFKLVRQGMRGRRRDTRLLISVVTLCFLFITLSSILLSSIQLSQQEQRISHHGRFQAAIFHVAEEELPRLSQSASHTAHSLILGQAQKTGWLGTMDQAYFDLGSFRLLEGSLPLQEDEVLLTRSALEGLPGNLQVGDSFQMVLSLPHVGNRAWLDLSLQLEYEHPKSAIAASKLKQMVEPRLRKGLSFEESKNFESWYNRYCDYLGPKITPFVKLPQELYQQFLYQWALSQEGILAYDRQSTSHREPFHLAGITLSLHSNHAALKLLGAGWGELTGDTIDFGGMYQQIIVARDVKIAGIIASYTDQWASGDNALPEAFVSPLGARRIREAIALAEEAHPELPLYEPRYTLLLYQPDQPAHQVYEQALLLRGDTRQPAYRITRYEKGSAGNTSQGSFQGINQKTGEVEDVYFYMSSDILLIQRPEGFYRAPEHLLLSGGLRLPGLDPLPLEPMDTSHIHERPDFPLQQNTLAYPSHQDAGGTLQRMMPGLLSVITLAAVLQIFLTQLRRRARRMALLKALGSDNRQAAKMLLTEALILLVIALPLGLTLGLLLSFGTVALLDALRGTGSIRWFISTRSLAVSILLGALALVSGVLLPMAQASRIPLMGAFEGSSKTPPRLKAGKAVKTLHYPQMIWRNAQANPGRSLLTLSLGVVILLAPLTSLFLGFHAFADYRREVQDKERPDYVLTAPYGMNQRVIREHLEALEKQVPSLARVDTWLMGDHVGLEASSLISGQSPILTALYALPVSPFEAVHSGASGADDLPKVQFFTTLWALESSSPQFTRLMQQTDLGTVNPEAFDKGREAILLVPRYQKEGNTLLLSSRVQDRQQFNSDTGIIPGQDITLYSQAISMVGDSKSREGKTTQVRVGAIIMDQNLPGVWPLSGLHQSHLLIGSPRLLSRVYPQTGTRMTAEQARWFKLSVEVFFPYNYGQTFFFAYAREGTDRESGDVAMLNFAREYGLDMKNYRTANEALYAAALHSALMIALLGSAVFLIALVIMGAALSSSVRQERKRFGILQSIGLTNQQLILGQARYGLLAGLISLTAANALLLLVVAGITALGLPSGASLLTELSQSTLRGYPFFLHGLLCLVYVLASAFLHAWPMRHIIRFSAITNILDTDT